MTDRAFPFARVLALAALCVMAASCRSWGHSCREPAGYADAQSGDPLKIPPALDAPDTTQALRIPDLKSPAPPPRQKSDPCLDAPPAFAVPKAAPEPAA